MQQRKGDPSPAHREDRDEVPENDKPLKIGWHVSQYHNINGREQRAEEKIRYSEPGVFAGNDRHIAYQIKRSDQQIADDF